MIYNFDEPVIRQGSKSVKYDLRKEVFGREDVIPMWVADMDFKTPPFIIDGIKERLNHEILGYTVRHEAWFTSIADWMKKRFSWQVDKDWISFSPGVVPAINICTLAFTEPGDSIIVQTPVYYPFFAAVTNHGRKLVYNQLKENDGQWGFDIPDLEKKASQGAKMLILSHPQNPIGRVWRPEELLQIAEICLKYNILIISDEIHSDLILPGYKHTPMASLSEDIANITIGCFAPSKTFNLAGMSTSSMIISNSDNRKRFNEIIKSLSITSGNIFGTEASIAAYTYGEKWLEELLVYIQGNIDYLIKRLEKDMQLIKAVKPEATYMVWLDCREMNLDNEELNSFFIEKAGIGMNQGSVFGPGGDGFMRINLACPKATVIKALDNIEDALRNL